MAICLRNSLLAAVAFFATFALPVSSALATDALSLENPFQGGVSAANISPAGTDWSLQAGAGDSLWTSVAWGGLPGQEKFVAVGSEPNGIGKIIMTSSNGITWFPQNTPYDSEPVTLTSVVWGGSPGEEKFVAVGSEEGQILTSSNGIDWVEREAPSTGLYGINSVTWGGPAGNKKFVAVGWADAADKRIMTSPDGINWTWQNAPSPDNSWGSVTWGGSPGQEKFVAVADRTWAGAGEQIMTSSNGVNWSMQSAPTADRAWKSVTWGGSPGQEKFVAVSSAGFGNRVMTSADGVTWSLGTTPDNNNWQSVAWGEKNGEGVFVAVGNSGSGNRVMTSLDGVTWSSGVSAADNDWSSVAWGGKLNQEKFVAVSFNGTVMTSSSDTAPPTAFWTYDLGPSSNANSFNYRLTPSEEISGLAVGDLSNSGTAEGCSFDIFDFISYYDVVVNNCSEGTLIPRLSERSLLDSSGNYGPESNIDGPVVTIDRTSPLAPTIANTTSPTNADTVYFAFSGEDLAAFECRVDSGSWEICTSPQGYDNIPEGSHVFEVRQSDQAGNTGPESSRSFVVDRTAPSAPNISGPSATNASTAIFSFSGEAGATFECKLDSEEWSSCVSPKTYPVPEEKSYVLLVRQTDIAGNTSLDASKNFVVDRQAPSAPSIVSRPSQFVSALTVTFQFSGEAGASFQCQLDEGAWGACSSPKSYSDLPDGLRTFRVRQTDAAGNTGVSTGESFVMDRSSPAAPLITSGPSGFIKSTDVSFVFSGEDQATFQCRLNSGSWGACTSPQDYSGLAQGGHTFRVRQRDQAGNTSPELARSWTIDTVLPVAPTITSGPAGPTNAESVTFAFSGEVKATFQCKMNSGSWESCLSPKIYGNLSPGSYVFRVRQIDQAGNVGPDKDQPFVVDRTPPASPSITTGPSGAVNSSAATFEFNGEVGASFECKLNSGTWSACVSPKTYSSLSQGSYTFQVRQKDTAGNTGSESIRTWTVDLTAPAAPSISSSPSGVVRSTSATFSFSGEAGASFECKLNSAGWEPCSSPKNYSGLSQGEHTFFLRQKDSAGNISPEISRKWTADTIAPASAPIITKSPPKSNSSTTASFTFVGEPGASFECKLEPGSWAACSSPKVYRNLNPGSYTFRVRQKDGAGNIGPEATKSWVQKEPVALVPEFGDLRIRGPLTVRRGKMSRFNVTVSNVGDSAMRNVKINLRGKNINISRSVKSLGAGRSKAVTLAAKFNTIGSHKIVFRAVAVNISSDPARRVIRVIK